MRRHAFVALLLATTTVLASCGGDKSDGRGRVFEGPALTSTDAVLDTMLARFETNLGDADGFVIRAGGLTAAFPALPDTGIDLSEPRITPVDIAAVESFTPGLIYTYLPNVRRLARGLRGAELNGPLDRNGTTVYVLSTEDPGELLGVAPSGTDGESTTVSVFVDAGTFAVREIRQAVHIDSLQRPISLRYVYDDFRMVDGVSLPYKVRQIKEGLDQLMPEETLIVQGGQLTLALEQIESQMPEGPDRDKQVADLQRQLRTIRDGIEEYELIVVHISLGVEGPQKPEESAPAP